MRERGRGAVLNISSASAIHPEGPPFASNVTAAKGTIYGGTKNHLTQCVNPISTGCTSDVWFSDIDWIARQRNLDFSR